MRHKIINRNQIKGLIHESKGDACLAASVMEARLDLPENDPKHLNPDQFSFAEIAQGLGGDVSQASYLADKPIFSEAVSASQFQTLVGVLLSKVVMDAYEAETKIADQLVTTFTSNLESDRVPGAYLKGDLENVAEGQPYPQTADIAEKYVTISHQKRGLMLNVTEEAVRFDRTGLVMREAAKLGQRAAISREKRVLYGIQDVTGYKSYYPTGTQQDLYENAGGSGDPHEYDNLVVDVLSDYTDINALWTLLRLMKDDNGDPIMVDPKILLVPVALSITATRIIENTVLAGGANSERNPLANRFKVLDSPYMDANSSTAWYLGDFKKQFLEKVIIPLQVTSRPMSANHNEGWNNDILAQYKVREDRTLGAVDYRFVGKSTGAGA